MDSQKLINSLESRYLPSKEKITAAAVYFLKNSPCHHDELHKISVGHIKYPAHGKYHCLDIRQITKNLYTKRTNENLSPLNKK